ncbi:MAG: sigma-70 family RNA polymerase sigma factor [Lewinellaceae bacterium]|nr:sigma-70 family RNA polymerase sigma factor [Lewinellaceae bacterium]
MANDVCKEEAYRNLFLSLAERLRNYLHYHCGNAQQAEDLAQEAFLRLWEHCQKIPPEKAKAFVYRVGYNLFLDGIKHRKVVLKFQKQQTEEKAVESPEFEYETKEFEARLWAAVAAMPEKSRVVFLMNRIDGCTYKEIAELLDIGVKAVEKRMGIALEGVRGVIFTRSRDEDGGGFG